MRCIRENQRGRALLKKEKTHVLHLLPHCGGGVGTVLRALLEAELKQNLPVVSSIASLELLNETTRQHCNKLGIAWSDCLADQGTPEILDALIKNADIILIHWWNHPLLMRLLFQGLPPSRLLLWSHVNGFYAPQAFFTQLFQLPDRFIFATQASFNAPVVQELSNNIKHKLRVIRSCAGIPEGAFNPVPKNGPFQFGYIGTVEPAKMHPEFLSLCASAGIQAQCIVAGGPSQDALRSQAKKLAIENQFDILGPVADTVTLFKRLHAFAYPLNPKHYGTGEQVLIEAMAFGAVPVVLSNPPERALIRHGKTGLIANTSEEFTTALHFLSDHPAERNRLAEAGRQFVLKECGIQFSVAAFHELYEEMLSFPKTARQLRLPDIDNVSGGSPLHLFLAACGNSAIRKDFEKMVSKPDNSPLPPEFMSTTRGTPHHYLRLLGNDSKLEMICNASQVKREATT